MWPGAVHGEMAAVFGSLKRSPDPVFITDRHNRIVFWNQSAEKILGFSAAEVVGKPCAALEGCDAFGNRYCSESCPVTGMGARGETVNHFGLQLKGRDSHVVTVDVTILNLGAHAPDDFFLAHILRPGQIELPSLQDADLPAPPPSPFANSRESPDIRARRLSAREVEVLGMLAAGRSTPEIAAILHISNLTARNHIQNILHKLEVHSKSEAVAFAFQKRLKLV
ncbi:MAG TPA: LuxR C-terminal-related transcriptional regulator [Thermoanaerobaculia bacterium]